MKDTIKNRHKLFGTDGIRGTPGVYPLTDEMLSLIADALARYIKKALGTSRKRLRIVIGKDTRLSGDKLEKLLTESITGQGVDVLSAGTITTPGLSYFVKQLKASCGVMISASHNKPTDNGIKFFNANGHKFSQAEEEKVEDVIWASITEPVLIPPRSAKKGKLSAVKNAQSRYVRFLLSSVKGLKLKGMTVALDCAWGAAAPFASRIFTKLGARVFAIHDKPSGHNINEGGAVNPHILKELVLEKKADLGIAVDGDGDRGILVDKKGQLLDGDCTIAVIARYLSENKRLVKNTVVATVMSNYGLKAALDERGIKLICTDVGDKYVLEALLKDGLNLGGEQSGHIIFRDYLCTPDGLLTALQMLRVMRDTGEPLSQLRKCITKYPQILVNVKVKERVPFGGIPGFEEKLRGFTEKLKDEGRVLLRYSGTEALARVMVEGRDRQLIEDIAGSLSGHIRQAIGVE